MSNELKVGLLLVAALGVLVWLSMASGTLGFGDKAPTRPLFAAFDNVEGVKAGSRVKMAGVDVGEVERVDLQPNGTAILRFHVKESVALPADVSAQITTSGLIGERFVALVPGAKGAAGDGGLLAADVKQLPALGNVDPANISTDFARMAEDMQRIIATLNIVLGDRENADKLQRIIDGLEGFTTNLDANSGGAMEDFSVAAKNLAVISEDLRSGKGVLGQLLVKDASGTTQNVNQTLREVEQAVREMREILQKINGGQGTLGKLVNDEETAAKFDSALDAVGDLQGMFDGFGAEANVEGVGLPGESGVFKGGVNGRVKWGNTFVDAGVMGDGFAYKSDNTSGRYAGRDFGSQTKFSAQVGRYVMDGHAAVRAGLKNNHAGVGVDAYGRNPWNGGRVTYSADAYDFGGNDTGGSGKAHVDLAARADLTKRVYGIVGYDNVLDDEFGAPMVGLGVRFGEAR